MGCPFRVKLRCSQNGQALFIKEIEESHNHEISEKTFKHHPRQRRLSEPSLKEAKNMLGVKANKKMVQQHFLKQSGKVVILKDLHNLASKEKKNEVISISALVEEMKKVNGAFVEVSKDESDTLSSVYFQTEEWRTTYARYPELVLIDATYKLNNLRMPLYIMMIVDGNGESEVIALWLVVHEDKVTISHLMDVFIMHNDTSNARCIMADKDFTERDVFAEKIPGAELMICLFHTLRTFRREITPEKVGITAAQKVTVLEIINKLVYARDEEEYFKSYQQLKDTKLQQVIQYFDDNWHGIRGQWVEGLKRETCHYLNSTNNRIESINQKIKSVVTKHSSLLTFFRDLMKCLDSLSVERDHRAVTMFEKCAVNVIPQNSYLSLYQKFLTPYAYSFVLKQFESSDKVKIADSNGDHSFDVYSNGKKLLTTDCGCNCGFYTAMELPCKHIFALRAQAKLDIFDAKLCAVRWTRDYYRTSHRAFSTANNCSANVQMCSIDRSPVVRVLSQHEKYRKAFGLSQRLASIASDISTREFSYAVECLEKIARSWEQGKHVKVEVVEESCLGDANDLEIVHKQDNDHNICDDFLDKDRISKDRISGSPYHFSNIPYVNSSHNNTDCVNDNSDYQVDFSDNDIYPDNPFAMQSDGGIPTDNSNAFVSVVPDNPPVIPAESDNLPADSYSDNPVDVVKASEKPTPDFIDLQSIALPPKTKKRGRLKGANLTVIGLPKKKKCIERPVKFLLKSNAERQRQVLNWMVPDHLIEKALHGERLDSNEICNGLYLKSNLLDENVNWISVKDFFTDGAWSRVTDAMMELENYPKWNCHTYSRDLSLSTSVACESCLNWYHLSCVGLTSAPKKAVWFCRLCYEVQTKMSNTINSKIVQPSVEDKRQPTIDLSVEDKQQPIAQPSVDDKQQPTIELSVEDKQQPIVQPSIEDKQQPTIELSVEDKQQPIVQPSIEDKRQPTIELSVEDKQQPIVQPSLTQESNHCPKVRHRKRRKVVLPSLEDKQQPSVQPPLQEPSVKLPQDKQICPELHYHKKRKVNNRNCCQHDVIERFTRLIGNIKQGDKLGDDHINAASQLLRDQFPDLQGLSTPAVGECFGFEKFNWMLGYAGIPYCQVLHTGSDHWVAIKAVLDSEVFVYDSIFTLPTYHVLKQIAALCHTKSSQIEIHLEKVQMQVQRNDCGVYAIAFLTDLCFGKNPASCIYDHKKIRSHLINCFETGKITPFPSTKTKEKGATLKMLNVYCQCRLPNVLEHISRKHSGEKVPYMVKCYMCGNLYHHTCVNVTLKRAKEINSNKETWFCSYNECEKYFGYLFDSDSD